MDERYLLHAVLLGCYATNADDVALLRHRGYRTDLPDVVVTSVPAERTSDCRALAAEVARITAIGSRVAFRHFGWFAFVLLFPGLAHAQQPAPETTPHARFCPSDVTAGSPPERVLLASATILDVDVSTTLRPLRRSDVEELVRLWRNAIGDSVHFRCGILRMPMTRVWFNSGAAQRDRDGAVWQGRGLTASISGGISYEWRFVSAAFRPVAAVAQNLAYSPAPVTARQAGDFREPAWPTMIDLPYRLGEDIRWMGDPGESYIRLGYGPWSVGATTESQHWGPAHFYPLMLGTEGPGYPRVFASTDRLRLHIADLSMRWSLGWLEASPYALLEPGDRSRLASAFVASIRPAGFTTLELGGGRFFHVRRDPELWSWGAVTLPFSGLLKSSSADLDVGGYNQLATIFARWAPRASGVELYAEFLREDHNADLRDLLGEPDHASAYTIGFRRVWRGDRGVVTVLTLERGNGRFGSIFRVRPQAPMYVHTSVREGHTFRGQPIGSSAILGGGGFVVAWNRIAAKRSFDITWESKGLAQNSEGGSWNGEQAGAYSVRVAWHRLTPRGSRKGSFVELQTGYGITKASNLALGGSWRP